MSNQEYDELLLESILEGKDLIPGGLADKIPDSEFDKRQLKKGIKAELEHTSDKEIAKEIAKDHLKEDPKYYDKLEKIENKSLTEKSHWEKRKSPKGEEAIKKEYSQHKKRRNETGAAREQNRRKRNTKRGSQQAAARDKIRREIEQGKRKRPKTCPKCGKSPGSTKTKDGKTLSNMIFDHTKGYTKEGYSKGQWLCRTCHNKKDNNKPGDTSKKNKRRTSGLSSIPKDKGDNYISKATRAESKEAEIIKFISENLNFLDGCK